MDLFRCPRAVLLLTAAALAMLMPTATTDDEPPKLQVVKVEKATLRVINVASRTMTLVWAQPWDDYKRLTSYTVENKNTTGQWHDSNGHRDLSERQTVLMLSGLQPSYTYNLSVHSDTTSGRVVATTLEEAPSGPPLEVSVNAIGSQSLEVSWQAPSRDDRNGLIRGYYVGYCETNSSGQFLYINKTTEHMEGNDVTLNHTILNLKQFTEYTVHLKAYNSKGISPQSDNITVSTLEDALSGPPLNVSVNAIGSQSLEVFWQAPSRDDSNGLIRGYYVGYYETNSSGQFLYINKTTEHMEGNDVTLNHTILNLKQFTNYTVHLKAYNSKGISPQSRDITNSTLEDASSIDKTTNEVAAAVHEEIARVKKELTVEPSTTTKSIRKKISAPDHRVSAKVSGVVAITFVAGVVGVIVLLDAASFIAHVRKLCRRRSAIGSV